MDPSTFAEGKQREVQRSSHAPRGGELHREPHAFAAGKQWVSSGEASRAAPSSRACLKDESESQHDSNHSRI
ncbi:hypothetical protein ACFQ3J_16140 [Paenibacillus provencensis]|uniref:Uncharacterized protein n=1 Tax=Paenibacillus provencensis TaxID=441151 RepID=A0ABW3PX05_9BACL|nr:hypothetical protein [Paenibacillus sp. MER 78]MCM3128201.1 hypothetical protein [Paenibacillus sp. MER 78]